MAKSEDERKIAGVVAVTRTKQIKRDLLGRITDERTQVAVSIDASVPNELIDAAKVVSTAAPKIASGAQIAGKAIKGRVAARLLPPTVKKKR